MSNGPRHGRVIRAALWVLASMTAVARGQSALPVPGQVTSASAVNGGGQTAALAGLIASHDNFGASVSVLGDVDGDGFDDLAVGAPGDDDGAHSPFLGDLGAVWILFSDASGGIKSAQKISAEEGGFTGVLDANDQFGTAVSDLGDLDGDSRVDVVVGAPGDDDGGVDCGAVWVLLLNEDGTVKSQSKLSNAGGSFHALIHPFDRFGIALAKLGDLSGDGTLELAIGVQSDDNGGQFFDGPGAVWIVSLFEGSLVVDQHKISKSSGAFPGDIVDGDQFGRGIAPLGDVNDDGVNDMAVGAPGDDSAGPDAGALWIVLLQPTGAVLDAVRVTEGQGGLTDTLQDYESFGTALALGDDLDGDGRRELFVGSPFGGSGAGPTGAYRMVSPAASGVVGSSLLVANGSGGFPSGLGNYDHFGNALTYLGDHDGDGRPTLAVGAPLDDVGFLQHGGSLWLLDLYVSPFETVWPGLAGAAGAPLLEPDGSLEPGSILRLDLINAPPLATALLVAGLDSLMAHFKGGVLVPSPDLVFLHTTDGFGEVDFGGPWPAGMPGGVTFYAQYWVVDATGPKGFTASNAVQGTSVGP